MANFAAACSVQRVIFAGKPIPISIYEAPFVSIKYVIGFSHSEAGGHDNAAKRDQS